MGGSVYTLCLLTNRAVLLDNNKFLGAKTELWLLILTVLGMLFILSLLLVMEIQRAEKRGGEDLEQEVQQLNGIIAKTNERLANQDLHNTGIDLWKAEVLPSFIQGLKERAAAPVVLMRICCKTKQAKAQFRVQPVHNGKVDRSHSEIPETLLFCSHVLRSGSF